MLTSDQIGKLAEYTAAMDLVWPLGRRARALFRATHLGEKHPTVDFLVEILGRRGQVRGFFFVQVKGTTRGSADAVRLPVAISPDEFNRLVEYPAPTYVVVVDVFTGASYIAGAHLPRTSWISSVARDFPLRSDATRIALYREVARFWRTQPTPMLTEFLDV